MVKRIEDVWEVSIGLNERYWVLANTPEIAIKKFWKYLKKECPEDAKYAEIKSVEKQGNIDVF